MRKVLVILTLLFAMLVNIQAQLTCDMPDDTHFYLKSGASDCGLISSYTLNPNAEHTPFKTLRIAFDIIQRGDGSGNFNGGNAHIISEFERLIDSANTRLGNIIIHSPALSSPFIPDCKVRLQLNDVYFYTDNNLYNYALQTGRDRTVADSIYDHVIQNRTDLSVIDKEHTLHVILLPGGQGCCGGQASWFADKEWIVMRGYDYAFNWGATPVREVVGHFIHEVGHSLGLSHTFSTSDCDRFTKNTTNNYMDYTTPSSSRVSLSDCQISKIHYCLMGNRGNIEDCFVQDYCIFNNQESILITSGQNITWNSSKNLRGNLVVENNAVLTINCDISLPIAGKVIVNSGGQLILEEGMFKNACDDIWGGIEVKSGGYLEVNSTTISDYSIIIKSGGTIRIVDDFNIQGDNQLAVESGGFICIDNNSAINLQDYFSVINLHSGYNSGVNISFIANPGTCVSSPENFTVTGIGAINTFNQDIYIQNETINSNRYITGNNIYVGRSVTGSKPEGDVIIKNGFNVIFNAKQNVNLEGGFEAEIGGTFEIK